MLIHFSLHLQGIAFMKTCCDWRISLSWRSLAMRLASKSELISAEVVRNALPDCLSLYNAVDLFGSCRNAVPPATWPECSQSSGAERADSASFRGPSSIELCALLWKVFGFFNNANGTAISFFFFLLIFIFCSCLFAVVEFSARRSANSTLAVLVEASRRSDEIAQSIQKKNILKKFTR